MPFFRRRPPVHERLAREGGLHWEPRYEVGTPFAPAGPALTGLHALREHDGVVVVDGVAVAGDELRFVVLADELLVEEGGAVPDELASAFDGRIPPPYRVRAVRRGPRRFALAAHALETARLPGIPGDEVELAVTEQGTTLLVDGMRTIAGAPELHALAQRRGLEHYVVHAERLDGDLWEVRVGAL